MKSNVFFRLVLISWMVTLNSCLIWQIINFVLPANNMVHVYAWTTLGNIATLLFKILAKKKSFQMKLILILTGKIVTFGAHKTRPHTLKSRRSQNESLFGANFDPESKMSKKRPLQSMAIVIGLCWTNCSSQKLKRRILATFGSNRTVLGVTQPKLHSMF